MNVARLPVRIIGVIKVKVGITSYMKLSGAVAAKDGWVPSSARTKGNGTIVQNLISAEGGRWTLNAVSSELRSKSFLNVLLSYWRVLLTTMNCVSIYLIDVRKKLGRLGSLSQRSMDDVGGFP